MLLPITRMKNAAYIAAAILSLVCVSRGVVGALVDSNHLRGASSEPAAEPFKSSDSLGSPHVVLLPPLEEGEQSKNHQSKRHRSLQTSRTVLILRLRSPSMGEPSVSANDLYYAVFSSDNSLKHQLARCSAGMLQLNPTAYGVVEMQVDNANSNTAVDDFISMATASALSYIGGGYSSIRDVADHIIIVLPKVNNFVAKAEIATMDQHGSTSTFNDANGASLSVLEHEFAHNLGRYHAWANGYEYGDTSGNMGQSMAEEGGPQSCYNAANHWLLQWYPDSRLDLTNVPQNPVTIEVPAFVDYQTVRSDSSKHVLVKTGSGLYFQYNMAKSYNSGTRSMPNKLVLVFDTGTSTNLVAGLDSSNPRYGDAGVQIEVCATQSAGSYDYMIVSVGLSSTNCNSQRAMSRVSSGSGTTSSSNPITSSGSQTPVWSAWTSSWFGH